MQYLEHIYTKKLFIWNANLTGCLVFYLANLLQTQMLYLNLKAWLTFYNKIEKIGLLSMS